MSITVDGIDILLLNVHSPDANKGHDCIVAFWKEIMLLLNKFKICKSRLFIGTDLNLQFGSKPSKVFGNFHAEKQTSIGVCELLDELRMFAPSSYACSHDTSVPYTCTHSTGSTHRIDYILIPQKSRFLPQLAGTIDLGYGDSKLDHRGTHLQAAIIIHGFRANEKKTQIQSMCV